MIPRAPLKEIPSYQVSQWLKLPLYLAIDEMDALLELLPEPFVPLSGKISPQDALLSKDAFRHLYREYLEKGTPDKRLTFAITEDLNDLRQAEVEDGYLHRMFRPVIQVQPYTLHYSTVAQKFHEMTFSPENFYWGLLFAYPQLYHNPITHQVDKVTEENYPNTKLFKDLQRWSRSHTVPSPFMVEEKKVIVPARIGKKLLGDKSWINLPQKSSP